MIEKRSEEKFFLIVTLIGLLSGFYFLLPEEFPLTNLFYLSVIFFSIYLAAMSEIQLNVILRKICFVCSFLVLFFTLAFRNVSGIDDIAYQNIFQAVQTEGVVSTFISSYIEPGFLLLQYLIGVFTDNYIVAQIVNTFIPITLFYMAFRKYSSFLSLPLAVSLFIALLYFQMLSVSLVRMFIAIGIVFYSIDCLWKQQPWRYFFRILLAASLHYSSLIMIMFLPFVFQKHWKVFLLSSTILLPVLFVNIARIASMLSGRYEGYGEINNLTFSLDAFYMLLFAVVAWFYRKSIPDEYRNLFVLSCVLILFSSLFELYSSMVSLGRCIFYMNLGLIVVLPIGYKFAKSGISRWMIGIIVFVTMLLYLYVSQFFNPHHSEYLFPYNNIFFRL
jgi:hypothetical protein